MTLLDVSGLCVSYPGAAAAAVSELAFSMQPGESLGIVGESGSGKTQTALALMGLLPANADVRGSIRLCGEELLGAPVRRLNQLRPQKMAMVFQDPLAALNPYLPIGRQLMRILIAHGIASGKGAMQRSLGMLRRVGLADPERQFRAYPHQLSGGMRQRALLASALIAEPDLLIADEPTTALDATVQAQILSLLRDLREATGTALLLITHDLGVIAENCERMLVLDGGRLLEEGTTRQIFAAPAHPGSRALIAAAQRTDDTGIAAPPSAAASPLLEVNRVSVSFRERRGRGGKNLHAVLPVSFSVVQGETLAIVGESGSGKTSLVRAVLGLLPKQSGSVTFRGEQLRDAVEHRPDSVRRNLQMVFQDPVASLDPAMRVGAIIAEPLWLHEPGSKRAAVAERVDGMLQRVGVGRDLKTRFPHELSGGQAQRVAIARALVLEPRVLICDEAVAALDGTVRREILSLLLAEQRRSALSLIMITHDLAVVRRMSHRVLVMYLGRVCEVASNAELFRRPRHPYTRGLLDAMPVADPARPRPAQTLVGEPGSILRPPSGCVFHPRCAHAIERCARKAPALTETAGGSIACHRAAELDLS